MDMRSFWGLFGLLMFCKIFANYCKRIVELEVEDDVGVCG